ncbi:protease PrsW [Fischerella major NIES-592]|uniref:Protease PrsW n=1 Tax=Fischerella major NIES-592 TaxID=210994 RepID=A0A1U7GUP1_9CYAN|nr:PrsW family glutamic-type intramembrane protease [Fischerella major]OKH11808.1 protease PrsW [Fischerella major NIES-592]
MVDLSLVPWAVVPPLLLLVYYYWRFANSPSLLRLLLFFVAGAISGFVALSLEWLVETQVNSFPFWRQTRTTLVGVALRQLLEVGPIEEGCKLIVVVALSWYFQRRQYRLRPTTVFLFTIALALGFTAEENWIYFVHNTASILERSLSTPVHAMFSAPWGYALALSLPRYHPRVAKAWFNSVICHALVNVLSSAWRYPQPLSFLSYGLFPFLLWMFWRLEQLLRKVQRIPPITLISGYTPQHRFWQRGLVMFALILGGNAIFGLFLLLRNLSSATPAQLFEPTILWFIFSRLLLNFTFGLIAWKIYRYLRNQVRSKRFSACVFRN